MGPMRLVVWTFVVALGLAAGNLRAQTELPWDSIFDKLASPDYHQREKGQKELDAIPPAFIDLVRQKAAAATDPEVQASLFNRVDAMEKYLALHPKPLSIDVKDATLVQVVNAINRDAGQKLVEAAPWLELRPVRFTLKVENESFWQIYRQLHQQHPINVDVAKPTLVFSTNPGELPTVVSDSVLLTAQCMVFPRLLVVNGRAAQAGGEMDLYVTGSADPRVTVLQVSDGLTIIEARDDQGADLSGVVGRPGIQITDVNMLRSRFAALGRLREPDGNARKLVKVKAAIKMVIATKLDSRIVKDAEKQFGTPMDFPGGSLILRKTGAAVSATWRGSGPRKAGLAASIPVAIVSIKDSAGNLISRTSLSQSSSSTTSFNGAVPGPLTMELVVAEETKEVVVPIELKDILLPGGRAMGLAR